MSKKSSNIPKSHVFSMPGIYPSNRKQSNRGTIRNLFGSNSKPKNVTIRNRVNEFIKHLLRKNSNKSQPIPKVIMDKMNDLQYLKKLQDDKKKDIEVEKQELEEYTKKIKSFIDPIKKHRDAINENEILGEAEKDDYEMKIGLLAIQIRFSDKRIKRYEKELESYDQQIEKKIQEIEIEKEKERLEKERLQRNSPITFENNPLNNNFGR